MQVWRPPPEDVVQAISRGESGPATVASAPVLTQAELGLLARLEGRPVLRGRALARFLGVGERTASALVRRLRRQGVLGVVSVPRLAPQACACVTYLTVDWAQLGDAEILEAAIRADAAIQTADRLAGACDYRLFSRHVDYRHAAAWDRRVAALPGVAQVRTRFCASVRDTPRFAAIRWGLDGGTEPE